MCVSSNTGDLANKLSELCYSGLIEWLEQMLWNFYILKAGYSTSAKMFQNATYALQESLGEMVASQIGWHSPVVPKQPSAAVCVAKQRTQLTAAIETLTNSCSLKTASLYVYLFVCLLWDCLHCFIPSLL